MDKMIRVWSLEKSSVIDFLNVPDYIISLSFDPSGKTLSVGNQKGKVSVYEFDETNDSEKKIKYSHNFMCRNRIGKFHNGRKVTGLNFVSRNQVLVTTNDSRIRLVNVFDGKFVQKYKGHENLNGMLRCDFNQETDCVASASDNGMVYIWPKIRRKKGKIQFKNGDYEVFKPFDRDLAQNAIFANEQCKNYYLKKVLNVSLTVKVCNLLICTSKEGKIGVIADLEDLSKS